MPTIPFRNHDALEKVAADFLDGYHRGGDIPIPIESIVDNKLQINIVPTSSLKRNFDIDALLSHDCTAIYVDEVEYDRNSSRYRFSLAHEVAHLLLHKDFIDAQSYASVDEWKRSREALPTNIYARLEYQANVVAGLILVPPDFLAREYAKVVRGIDDDLDRAERLEGAAQALFRRFHVSPLTMSKRLEYDELV